MQDLPTQLHGRSALAFSSGPIFAHSLLRVDVATPPWDWSPAGHRCFGGPTFTRSYCFRP